MVAYSFTTRLRTSSTLWSRGLSSMTTTLARFCKSYTFLIDVVHNSVLLKGMAADIIAVWLLEFPKCKRTLEISCHTSNNHVVIVTSVICIVCCISLTATTRTRCGGSDVFSEPCPGMRQGRSIWAGMESVVDCTLEVSIIICIVSRCRNRLVKLGWTQPPLTCQACS